VRPRLKSDGAPIMSMTKRLIEEMEEEQGRKREALLDVPSQLSETSRIVERLQEQLENNVERTERLETKLTEANSLKMKLWDYLISGLVGAGLAMIISLAFGV
jgi:hypothetical protein